MTGEYIDFSVIRYPIVLKSIVLNINYTPEVMIVGILFWDYFYHTTSMLTIFAMPVTGLGLLLVALILHPLNLLL